MANACELDVPRDGLMFPPCGADELAATLRPQALGGVLEADGMVEVVSSLKRDGSPVPRDLRWGVYVVLKAQSDYAAACFKQYGLPTDATGRYAAMYKPFHLIGLELSIDAARVVADCLDRRLLINATHGHVIRLLPALTLADEQIDEGCAILADVLRLGVGSRQ